MIHILFLSVQEPVQAPQGSKWGENNPELEGKSTGKDTEGGKPQGIKIETRIKAARDGFWDCVHKTSYKPARLCPA